MSSLVLSILVIFLSTFVVGIFGVFVCFLLYLHYLHKINKHLPGPPRSSFILGNLPEMRKFKATTGRTAGEYILEKRLEYGPIFLLTFVHRAIVVIGDALHVREVFINNHEYLHKNPFMYHKLGFIYGERVAGYGLVTNTDEASWKKRRQLMNPAFHRKCLKGFMGSFNTVSDQFLARMDKIVNQEQSVSMVQEFGKVTLEVISQVSFNINTNAIQDPNSPFPSAVCHYLKGVQDNAESILSPTLLGIFQIGMLQNAEKKEQIMAGKFLRKFARDCITSRKQDIKDGKEVPDDLLNVLIKDGSLSMDDIIDEFLTVFVAGQETTANSLAFTLFEVVNNPEIEAKVLDEVIEVLDGRDFVEFEDLAQLTYLSQVLQESLRKHPVALSPGRCLEKEIRIAGYRIPKGNLVVSSQLLFGRNPEIWKDPEVFDPDRFLDTGSIPNFSTTYFPFSVGPRNCIGQSFAKFESKVILAKLLRKFQFKLLPGQTDRMESRLTMKPQDGVVCKVTRR